MATTTADSLLLHSPCNPHQPPMLSTSALNRVLVAAAVVALLWLGVAWALSA